MVRAGGRGSGSEVPDGTGVGRVGWPSVTRHFPPKLLKPPSACYPEERALLSESSFPEQLTEERFEVVKEEAGISKDFVSI